MSIQIVWLLVIIVCLFGNIILAKTLRDISREQLKLTNDLLKLYEKKAQE